MSLYLRKDLRNIELNNRFKMEPGIYANSRTTADPYAVMIKANTSSMATQSADSQESDIGGIWFFILQWLEALIDNVALVIGIIIIVTVVVLQGIAYAYYISRKRRRRRTVSRNPSLNNVSDITGKYSRDHNSNEKRLDSRKKQHQKHIDKNRRRSRNGKELDRTIGRRSWKSVWHTFRGSGRHGPPDFSSNVLYVDQGEVNGETLKYLRKQQKNSNLSSVNVISLETPKDEWSGYDTLPSPRNGTHTTYLTSKTTGTLQTLAPTSVADDISDINSCVSDFSTDTLKSGDFCVVNENTHDKKKNKRNELNSTTKSVQNVLDKNELNVPCCSHSGTCTCPFGASIWSRGSLSSKDSEYNRIRNNVAIEK